MKKNLIKRSVNRKAHSGFTLIEVLIVVLIIGILAAIALPKYQMATLKTRYRNLMVLTKAIASANERYYMATGAYATTFDALDIALPEGGQRGAIGGYNYINYDWGFCILVSGNSASCRSITSLKSAYITYYDKSTTRAGRRVCYALTSDTEDKYNKVCKDLTGRQTPTNTETCTTIAGTYPCRGYLF